MELKLELNINPTLTIHYIEDENDDPETIAKLKQKIKHLNLWRYI